MISCTTEFSCTKTWICNRKLLPILNNIHISKGFLKNNSLNIKKYMFYITFSGLNIWNTDTPKRGTMILQNYCKLSTIPKHLVYNWPYNNKKEIMEWRPNIVHVIIYFLSCEIIFGEGENFHVYIIQVWHRTLHQDQGRKYIFPSKFKFLVFDLVIF